MLKEIIKSDNLSVNSIVVSCHQKGSHFQIRKPEFRLAAGKPVIAIYFMHV